MRLSRVFVAFLLLASLASMSPLAELFPNEAKNETSPSGRTFSFESSAALISSYHGRALEKDVARKRLSSDQAGIREDVPEKYRSHYQQWKKEFLSTEVGRNEWAFYANSTRFRLTITFSRNNPEGATTGNYKWNEAGELVAATITLGTRLDQGFPNPIYFPVMNSLVPTETSYKISGSTLAATKLAHEFGHVNRTAKVDPVLYQLQGELIPQYNQIFLGNGRNANDPRLTELARRMGGTPVEVWEDREYWGETNAMLYLSDRFAQDGFRCLLMSRIRSRVDLYAKSYEQRFLSVFQSTPSINSCGW
jgi:hypothetical protein